METLYRKYRPIDFDTVVGQEAVVKTLKNQIIRGSIAHAYLFCGTRGTGKTTIAKIFARAINCPNENNGNPCNASECNTCKQALEGSNLNIIEMDAASNRKIEDIRRISDIIAYPPINDEKYKVIIIDEAHALTKEATQAFLKILEEPPEYVVYILATTDPNKLPETILSRCQKYSFKRINVDTMVSYLRKICDEEHIDIDDESLVFIAEKSDGSMRESISKLDRCRSYAGVEKLTKEIVLNVLGIVDDDDFRKLTEAIKVGNVKDAFSIIGECIDKGKDIVQFTNDFIWHLRNLLLVKDLNKPVESLNISSLSFDKIKKDAELLSKDTLIYFIEELSKTSNVMKYDENRRVILETTIMKLSSPKSSFLESAVMARVDSLEEKILSGSYVKMAENQGFEPSSSNKEVKEKKIEEAILSPATFEEINKVIENWHTIVSSLDRVARTILFDSKATPANEKEPGCIEVLIDDEYNYKLLKENNKLKKIEEDLKSISDKVIGKNIIYKIKELSESKYSGNAVWKLDDAKSKIDMPIGNENDK